MESDSPRRKVFRVKGKSIVEVVILPDIFGKRPAAYIHKVYTESEHQGKGLATGLLREAIEYARKEDCFKVFLICKDDVIPFYTKLGFKAEQAGMVLKLG
jgi:GNAT superfamily N-acetyltransferase